MIFFKKFTPDSHKNSFLDNIADNIYDENQYFCQCNEFRENCQFGTMADCQIFNNYSSKIFFMNDITAFLTKTVNQAYREK